MLCQEHRVLMKARTIQLKNKKDCNKTSKENSRRGGRAAEGAPLLREYGALNSIEGSNPSLSAIHVNGF
jgi:hypothetical protein